MRSAVLRMLHLPVQDLEAREAQETAHACRQQDVQHKEVMRLQEQV